MLAAAPALAAGIDETINSATEPIAEAIVRFVFFKISVAGADLPVVVLWLVATAVAVTVGGAGATFWLYGAIRSLVGYFRCAGVFDLCAKHFGLVFPCANCQA